MRKPDDFDRGIRKWRQTGGHLLAVARRRETLIFEDIKGAFCRPVLQAKGYKYFDQCSGVINITPGREYLWTTGHASSFLDSDLDAEIEHNQQLETDFRYEEVEQFQVYETDDAEEWELCELMMEHYILKGRGREVYDEYRRTK